MVNPVQLSNISNVQFKANDDLLSSPGKFSASISEPQNDTVELNIQNEEPVKKKKGSVGKTLAKLVGGLFILSAAAWGIYYSKGTKWINKNATTTTDKIKNILAKPGEWLDENIVKKIYSGKKTNAADVGEEILESAEEAAK